jgi:hypothetical protein
MMNYRFEIMSKFYNIPVSATVDMDAAMDKAAEKFHSYPGHVWQLGFEMGWLMENGYEAASRKAGASIDEYMEEEN